MTSLFSREPRKGSGGDNRRRGEEKERVSSPYRRLHYFPPAAGGATGSCEVFQAGEANSVGSEAQSDPSFPETSQHDSNSSTCTISREATGRSLRISGRDQTKFYGFNVARAPESEMLSHAKGSVPVPEILHGKRSALKQLRRSERRPPPGAELVRMAVLEGVELHTRRRAIFPDSWDTCAICQSRMVQGRGNAMTLQLGM
ncbi:hypothetical protein MHYP_G00271920 [Metynnis hypsauchen]